MTMQNKFSAQWYRLNVLENMDRDTMKDMLAFLAGYTDVGFDKAYESATGNSEIALVEDDPDYAPTMEEWESNENIDPRRVV